MYWKEIIYMSLFEDEMKKECVGYLKAEKKQDNCRLEIQVKKMPLTITGNFPIRIQSETGWQETGALAIKDGCGKWSGSVTADVVKAEIILSDAVKIRGESKKAAVEEPYAAQEISARQEEHIPQETSAKQQEAPAVQETSALQEERAPILHAEAFVAAAKAAPVKTVRMMPAPVHKPLYEDKWEQLLSTYERIHPYGDTRVYVKLEPKDFIVLRENYQHLVNNSFLLHGFYNYRYLILGKEGGFYLGVPGVFYEREKMVALMFGFEAFECEGGEAEEGKFGYYLRKVEL